MSRNNKLAINGILLLDKPSGISSNGALQRAKRFLQAKKAGHTGSLDPLATGLLPICFGEATKFSHYFLDADKQYQVTAQLGVATNTADAEGEVIETCPYNPEHTTALLNCIPSFIGESTQIPPMYSALKHQGKPLYELARNGIIIDRPPRPIIIYDIQNIQVTESSMSFSVHCSKGTYIRTLVEDIAKQAGTWAHVTSLRRIGVGGLPREMISLDQVEQDPQSALQQLLPIDQAISHFKPQTFSTAESQRLKQGVPLAKVTFDAGLVRLYDADRQFFGIGEVDIEGRLKPVRLIQL